MTIHEKQNNYKCNSCEKSYTSSQNLKIHIETIHEAKRHYKCDTCAKPLLHQEIWKCTSGEFMHYNYKSRKFENTSELPWFIIHGCNDQT